MGFGCESLRVAQFTEENSYKKTRALKDGEGKMSTSKGLEKFPFLIQLILQRM